VDEICTTIKSISIFRGLRSGEKYGLLLVPPVPTHCTRLTWCVFRRLRRTALGPIAKQRQAIDPSVLYQTLGKLRATFTKQVPVFVV